MTNKQPWENILSDRFVPPDFFHRETQLKKLLKSVSLGHSFFWEGASSTGKTVTALKYRELVHSPNNFVLYLKSQHGAFIQDIRKALLEVLGETMTDTLTFPYRELFGPYMIANNIHIIIEDAHRFFTYKMKKLSNLLRTCWDGALEREKKIHMHIISTSRFDEFDKLLGLELRSRYRFRPIIFNVYDPEEIYGIYQQRLNMLNLEYEEAALRWFAAHIKRHDSDLRLGFEVLRDYVVQYGVKAKITEKRIKEVWQTVKTDYWKDRIIAESDHSQMLLYAATRIAAMLANTTPIDEPFPFMKKELSSWTIFHYYRWICETIGEEPLYSQLMCYRLKKLTSEGWLAKTSVVHEGRYGQSTHFTFEAKPENLMRAFEQLDWVKRLKKKVKKK